MNLKKRIMTWLLSEGWTIVEQAGIIVATKDGKTWDFTVPMERKGA